MDYGILICTKKGKKYCGKSSITYKALYRVMYTAYFFKEGEKLLGFIDGQPFTFDKSFNRKSEMDKFLREGKDHTC